MADQNLPPTEQAIAAHPAAVVATSPPVEQPVSWEQGLSIATVVAEAVDVFGNKEAALHWLNTPNLALHGSLPFTLLLSGSATEVQQVRDLLVRIDYGMLS